jgi:hypothetical protein
VGDGRQRGSYTAAFIRDFMALYKFNELILEMNAAMRLERHPEVNAGAIELARDLHYSRRVAMWGDHLLETVHGRGLERVVSPAGYAYERPGSLCPRSCSLLFLHACAKPAANAKAHRAPYNPADTAELLGWYEVVYEDGFVDTLPIRYGVNVLEWHWRRRRNPGSYCYGADPVDVGRPDEKPITFFALEWVNPRFGKAVKEVRLRGETILWAGLSFVKKRARP